MLLDLLSRWPVMKQIREGGDGTGVEAMSERTRTLAPRIAGPPACAKACPTESIQFGDLKELRVEAQARTRELEAQGIHDAIVYDPAHTSVEGHSFTFPAAGRSAHLQSAAQPGSAYNLYEKRLDLRRDCGWNHAGRRAAGVHGR